MPVIEEITQIPINIWNWFAQFADIGDMFVQLWNGFVGFFTQLFCGIAALFG